MSSCKDCVADLLNIEPKKGWRPAPYPGPRCATHHRAWKKRTSERSHGRRIQSTYGISADTYQQILELQGYRCAICQIANGRTKRLAVDHDHSTGEVRGLLCGPCNLMIGRLSTNGLLRAINYLHAPPARKVLQ